MSEIKQDNVADQQQPQQQQQELTAVNKTPSSEEAVIHDDMRSNDVDSDSDESEGGENYAEFGYTQINNEEFDYHNDEEDEEIDDSECTIENQENIDLTFDDFDADFEKALAFVLQNNNPPPSSSNNNNVNNTKKKKIKITLGAQDPTQKIQYLQNNEETLSDNPTSNNTTQQQQQSIEERINESDIILDSEKVNSIKNIIKDIELNPPKDLKWFSEDDWLIKLKKLKDEE